MSKAAELAKYAGGIGTFTGTGEEYFQVNLTTDQTGLTSSSVNAVDFGGSGTVEYDTASNFDSANDAYLLNSSDGVYEISFSVGIRANDVTVEKIAWCAAVVQIATDGTSFTPYKGSTNVPRDSASEDEGSALLANSFIYKATTATTKLKVMTFAAMASSQTYNIETSAGGMLQSTDAAVTDAHVTFLSVLRIA